MKSKLFILFFFTIILNIHIFADSLEVECKEIKNELTIFLDKYQGNGIQLLKKECERKNSAYFKSGDLFFCKNQKSTSNPNGYYLILDDNRLLFLTLFFNNTIPLQRCFFNSYIQKQNISIKTKESCKIYTDELLSYSKNIIIEKSDIIDKLKREFENNSFKYKEISEKIDDKDCRIKLDSLLNSDKVIIKTENVFIIKYIIFDNDIEVSSFRITNDTKRLPFSFHELIFEVSENGEIREITQNYLFNLNSL